MNCRTLANNIETYFLLISLYFLEKSLFTNYIYNKKNYHKLYLIIGICIGALNIYSRPTVIIILIPLWLIYCYRYYYYNNLKLFILISIICCLLIWYSCIIIDYWFYYYLNNYDNNTFIFNNISLKELFILPLFSSIISINFLYFNVIKEYSSTFGVKPFYWYFTEVNLNLNFI